MGEKILKEKHCRGLNPVLVLYSAITYTSRAVYLINT